MRLERGRHVKCEGLPVLADPQETIKPQNPSILKNDQLGNQPSSKRMSQREYPGPDVSSRHGKAGIRESVMGNNK